MSQVSSISVTDAIASFPEILGTSESVPPKRFTVLRVVGSGVSGTAFLVHSTELERNVIAKITDLSQLSEKKKNYARSEIRCLSQCEHFAIIKHIDSADTPDHSRLLLLMELADAGDLARQIKHRGREMAYFREHEVAFLFLQIVLAVDYMHRNAILHRDIKSANVFLMSCGIVKIGDLGFSQLYMDAFRIGDGNTTFGSLGKGVDSVNHYYSYFAPELWRRHRYSKKADVWSLGVLLYEMAALKRPYVAGSMIELYARVVSGDYEPLPQQFSQDMCDVIRNILRFDPEHRPATTDILNMPYMRFVAQQFENTINQNTHISKEDTTRILAALKEAREASAAAPVDTPGSLPAERVVQKRGVVNKLGTGGWKQRYLLLAGGVLTISVIENTVGDTTNLSVTNIQGVMTVNPTDVGNRTGCFCIVLADNNGSHMYFQCTNEEEAKSWVVHIEAALEVDAKRLAAMSAAPIPNAPAAASDGAVSFGHTGTTFDMAETPVNEDEYAAIPTVFVSVAAYPSVDTSLGIPVALGHQTPSNAINSVSAADAHPSFGAGEC